jgi:hypothetical protein
MNELEWLNDIQWQDLEKPTGSIDGETFYTVYMADFLRMPALDFVDLATIDPSIKALLN